MVVRVIGQHGMLIIAPLSAQLNTYIELLPWRPMINSSSIEIDIHSVWLSHHTM